jgi:hypothetical protein
MSLVESCVLPGSGRYTSGRSLFQKNPERSVSECDREASINDEVLAH